MIATRYPPPEHSDQTFEHRAGLNVIARSTCAGTGISRYVNLFNKAILWPFNGSPSTLAHGQDIRF
jgi:hypothetical protein